MTQPAIEEKLEEQIQNTVESEQEYIEYIEREKDRRLDEKFQVEEFEKKDEQEVNTHNIQLEEPETNPNLDSLTGRVNEIEVDTSLEQIRITFEDKDAEEHTETVPLGIPEDRHNKYVRLCEWLDINPEYPTELRGHKIPITDNSEIDYPPVQKRLNPYWYSGHRIYYQSLDYIQSKNTLSQILEYITYGFALMLPAIGFVISFGGFAYMAEATRNSTELWIDALSFILFLPLLILCFASTMACFNIYGLILLEGLGRLASRTVTTLGRIHRYLFPKSN